MTKPQLELADLGIPVFPCSVDKRPLTERGFQDATLAPDAGDWPLIGVPTGPTSGFDVLDIDTGHDKRTGVYDAARDGRIWYEANRRNIPATFAVATRRGGMHLYFAADPELRSSADRVAPGVDVRASGGYVIHWASHGEPVLNEADPVAWPGWLKSLLTIPQRASTAPEGVQVAKLASPSVAAAVALIERLPNPATAGRDTYVRVMLGARGTIQGLEARGIEDTDAIAEAAISWAERWGGGSDADERDKWEADWSQRDAPLAGWESLEAVAEELTPGYRLAAAQNDFINAPIPAEPATPDDWRSMLLTGEQGGIKACSYNAILALTHDPAWSGVLALNTFSSKLTFRRAPPWHRGAFTPTHITDADFIRVAAYLQADGIPVNTATAAEAVLCVCDDHAWHPVREYLDALVWDGKERLDTWLCDHLGAAPSGINRAFSAKFLIGMVARVMRPGCKMDNILILEGRQDLQKSGALNVLAGGWFVDHMPDLHNKDAMQQLQGVWLIEFAELDKIGKTDASIAKKFLSTASDRFRASYGRSVMDHPRQCAFSATVNPGAMGYLQDETGNRRQWTVACGIGWQPQQQVDIKRLASVRDQLFAEAAKRFSKGEVWWLTSDTDKIEQTIEAEKRVLQDAWHDRIASFLDDKQDVTISDVLTLALGKPVDRWTHADQTRVGRVLTILQWHVRQIRLPGGNGVRERRYFKPGYESIVALPSHLSNV